MEEKGQKMKFGLIAKIEQLGPVKFFYTLSCANKRWEENLGVLLHEVDVQIHYERNNLTDEIKIFVTVRARDVCISLYTRL